MYEFVGWISWKRLKIEARIQWSTDRKWHMWIESWSMTSRDFERSGSWLQCVWGPMLLLCIYQTDCGDLCHFLVPDSFHSPPFFPSFLHILSPSSLLSSFLTASLLFHHFPSWLVSPPLTAPYSLHLIYPSPFPLFIPLTSSPPSLLLKPFSYRLPLLCSAASYLFPCPFPHHLLLPLSLPFPLSYPFPSPLLLASSTNPFLLHSPFREAPLSLARGLGRSKEFFNWRIYALSECFPSSLIKHAFALYGLFLIFSKIFSKIFSFVTLVLYLIRNSRMLERTGNILNASYIFLYSWFFSSIAFSVPYTCIKSHKLAHKMSKVVSCTNYFNLHILLNGKWTTCNQCCRRLQWKQAKTDILIPLLRCKTCMCIVHKNQQKIKVI